MADVLPNTLSRDLGNGLLDMDSHTFKCCLLTSTYTPSATHAGYANLTNEVASGNGYTTGGATLSDVVWTLSTATTKFDATDVSWTEATFTARYAAIYDDTAAGKPLICIKDFGSDKTVSNGTFTVQFNASGILTVAPAA